MPDSLENASVDEVLQHIGPGKLIRSDVLAWVVEHIRDLEDRVGDGPAGQVTVPNLIGRTLGNAIDTLGQSSLALRLGRVLDTSGALVNTSDARQRPRVLLAQFPPPNDRVAPNSVVEFLAAPLDETETTAPAISGITPSRARINELVTITGQNFPSSWPSNTNNAVTFDGAEGEVQAGSSTPTAITVRVPEDIPDAPAEEGEVKEDVTVAVTVDGQTAETTMTVLPAPTDPVPQITDAPAIADVEETITIEGENFSGTPSDNTVFFGAQPQSVETATSTSLEVVVPQLSGLGTTPGDFLSVSVSVQVGDLTSNEVPMRVVVPFP